MPTTTHTDNKSKRYRTLVLIIGVLVALVIGMSVSASAFSPEELLPELPGSSDSYSTLLKSGSLLVKSFLSL